VNWRRILSPPSSYRSVWVATVLLFLVSLVVAPNSLSGNSVGGMLSFAAVLMVVAAGQTVVVQQRGLDLSIPGVITLCAMVLPIVMSRTGMPFAAAVLVTLAVGAAVGLVNGLLVTVVGITPLIVTLAMNSILVGAVLFYTNQRPSASAPPELIGLLAARPLGVPVGFLIAVVLVLLLALVLSWTTAGRRFVAAGSNAAVARAAGIPVQGNVIGAYVLSGLTAAIGSMLLIGYVESATVTIGDEYLFTSIAAVVIGGTSFLGGRGSVIASAVGAIFLTQLVQLLLSAGAPTSVRLLSQALAIAVAVALRTLAPRIRSLVTKRDADADARGGGARPGDGAVQSGAPRAMTSRAT
jgi:ribose transport system permease protein